MPDTLPLRDIHLPADVSVWPPAIGWWLIAAVMTGLITVALWHFQRHRVRRAALAWLKQIELRFGQDRDSRHVVAEISTLLRRVCLTYRPRRDVASLTGEHWREALAAVTRKRGHFSPAVARQVSEAPYDPSADVDVDVLLEETRRWMRALPPLREAA